MDTNSVAPVKDSGARIDPEAEPAEESISTEIGDRSGEGKDPAGEDALTLTGEGQGTCLQRSESQPKLGTGVGRARIQREKML